MSEKELDSSINNYIEVKSNNIKQLDWDMAIGLQEVDNLKPSKYLGKLLKENVIGEKTIYEVEQEIKKYYTLKEEKKVTRWRTIAESAAKQSGRGVLPEVTAVKSFSEALSMANEMDYVMIPYELCEGMKESVLSFTEASQIKRGGRIGIFIGPEGGFAKEEIDVAKEAGAKIITLGNRILRTETAGLAVLSILMFQMEQ